MSGLNPSHRFVVVYRAENREIHGAATIWRGWIERIPDPRQREMDRQKPDRIDFRDLTDLPRHIETLIERSDPPPASTQGKTSRRRPKE
ncbi:hypothetical protein [Celeribacter arenosi]|uniref:hypothetical protein n=1 Tax=Celeribacter arenosi TaxID=792649 RepID=UPI0031E22993